MIPFEEADGLTKLKAYDSFDQTLAGYPDGIEVQAEMARYLANDQMQQRASLMAVLADRETQLVSPDLLTSVRKLLVHPESYTRRMAALALFGGGGAAEAALQEEMGTLPKDIALDFVALFRIASGLV
jgi:hypothetical protein